MPKDKIYNTPANIKKNAYLNTEQYQKMYQHSINDPESFWKEQADQFITWFSDYKQIRTGHFETYDTQWFEGGTLNASYNCLDRHLKHHASAIAIIWEGDDPKDSKKISYHELHAEVCRFANVLKKYGISKGDRVCIYMPMIPEAIIAMLACTRIGAIHSVVFGGFSPESLQHRIIDAECSLLITADEGLRGGKIIPLKQNADTALNHCPSIKHVIVVRRTGNKIPWNKKDVWYHDAIKNVNKNCPPEIMNSTDPLFILYTSGSTGKPKGILHSTAGYLVYVASTFHYVFDYHTSDIFWCTADIGWITGHSYLVYGPLLNAATIVLFEGVPYYPDYSRFWTIIDKYQVNIFYTAPTAIRALRKEGDQWVKSTIRNSLKLLGTVGEPINPDVWEWYYKIVGENRCPIVDTWWQTETGGILISPLPGATSLKPGSATLPLFGIVPDIIDDQGNSIKENKSGKLVITQPWPGMMHTVYGDHQRFIETYFKEFPGKYSTGDSARYDADGYYWIAGRNDDVIKISGHRIGTEEVESALLKNAVVSEAAVIAIPDEIKGNAIYAFVTLKTDTIPSDALKEELINSVREHIGAIATPKTIQWAQALPKTRSGKIMRRILRKIACNEMDDLGDTSTLADPGIVEHLIQEKINK